MELINYFIDNYEKILGLFGEHLVVSGISILIAVLIGVPIGILITKRQRVAQVVLYIAGVIQTIPSIALFGLLIPIVGIGNKPAIIALVAYGQLAIIRNVYTGIVNVDPSYVEAALGMGMTNWQILWRIQIPTAFSIILGGVRIATVSIVGITTIASYIGAGGLGQLIFRGITTLNIEMVLAGSITVAVLALSIDYILGVFERMADPVARGKKGSHKKLARGGA